MKIKNEIIAKSLFTLAMDGIRLTGDSWSDYYDEIKMLCDVVEAAIKSDVKGEE